MKFVILCVAPIVLFANSITTNIDNNISVSVLRSFVPKNIVVDDKELKKEFQKQVKLAKMFLSESNGIKAEQAKYLFIEALSFLQKQNILEKEKIHITDDIAYSYYLANKKNYKVQKSVDLVVLTFDDEKSAKKYTLKDKTINFKEKKYNKLSTEMMLPNFMLSIANLKENELSDVLQHNGKFVRVYFSKQYLDEYLPFKSVKKDIVNELLSKKQDDVIKKALDEK